MFSLGESTTQCENIRANYSKLAQVKSSISGSFRWFWELSRLHDGYNMEMSIISSSCLFVALTGFGAGAISRLTNQVFTISVASRATSKRPRTGLAQTGVYCSLKERSDNEIESPTFFNSGNHGKFCDRFTPERLLWLAGMLTQFPERKYYGESTKSCYKESRRI